MLTVQEQFALLESDNPEGSVKVAVEKYLGGDWQRRGELFTFNAEEFKSWCDTQDVSKFAMLEKATGDGLYLIQEGPEWLVYWQEHGSKSKEQKFTDLVQARRAAIYAARESVMGYKEGLV